jgi:hypothetical protein
VLAFLKIGKSHPGPRLYAEVEGEHGCQITANIVAGTDFNREPIPQVALHRGKREGGRGTERGKWNWKHTERIRRINQEPTTENHLHNTSSKHIINKQNRAVRTTTTINDTEPTIAPKAHA